MEVSLKNQIALITGSSSGIGAGIAQSMAESGATVVINYPFMILQKEKHMVGAKREFAGFVMISNNWFFL